MTSTGNTPEMIEVKSLISGRTMEPLVEIVWGDKRAQLSLSDARNHALWILECAEASESDAFVFLWLSRDVVGTESDKEAEFSRVMSQFQQFRQARMEKKMTLEEKRQKYLKLAHAMQTGVAYKRAIDESETDPKHLRVGINSSMVTTAALSGLLVAKGVITDDEYFDALIAAMEREMESYQDFLANHYGKKITLL